MQRPFLIVEAYARLLWYDVFMSRHDLAALCHKIKRIPLRSRVKSRFCTTDIDSALSTACAFYPRQVLCLQHSAVLVQMLRARGSAAKLVIGTQTLPFKAHAWVEMNGEILNDRLASRETFQILEVL